MYTPRWQKTDDTVSELHRATIDGVLFRTSKVQRQKRNRTDNSCLVGYVNVQNGRNQGAVQKCYGIIQRLYLHFMYPPPPNQTYKLTVEKLKDIKVPWMVCAECLWYEEIGKAATTGLTRIRPNEFWEEGCPLIDLVDCHPSNVVFWPEAPFDPDKFDDDGNPTEESADNFTARDGNYAVITHSDEL
jgi:hypothetical protein